MASDGGPAFPVTTSETLQDGMTLRDYFAAKAMAAMVGSFRVTMRGTEDARKESDADLMWPHTDMILDKNGVSGEYDGANEIAAHSYIIADAMLAARDAKP